jgi:hypothetical protein
MLVHLNNEFDNPLLFSKPQTQEVIVSTDTLRITLFISLAITEMNRNIDIPEYFDTEDLDHETRAASKLQSFHPGAKCVCVIVQAATPPCVCMVQLSAQLVTNHPGCRKIPSFSLSPIGSC